MDGGKVLPRYTASVVGGGSGGKLSLAALAASSRYDLVAAADLRADVRSELAPRYPAIRLYATHEEMFAASPTDVVCVSTWPPSHREIVLHALRLGPQGILCEKPLGDTAAAGAEILRAVKGAGLPVVVPHGLMQSRHAQEIVARVRGGEIGELDLVEIECSRWDILNAGIHWLNFFVNLVPDDPMDWVMAIAEASTRTYRDGMEVETSAITYVQTQKGVRCVMHTGDDVLIRRPDKGILFRLVGTGGQIEFYAWESRYRIVNAGHPEGQLYEVPRHPQSAHQRYLESLAVQIDTGTTDYAIPDSSLVALELCEGAYLSSAHRCKVTLPLAGFTVPPEPDWHPGQPYRGEGGRDGRKL
jgi:predicted dehydrogenase